MHTHMHTHMYTHAYPHVHICTHMHTHMYTCTHACIPTCTHTPHRHNHTQWHINRWSVVRVWSQGMPTLEDNGSLVGRVICTDPVLAFVHFTTKPQYITATRLHPRVPTCHTPLPNKFYWTREGVGGGNQWLTIPSLQRAAWKVVQPFKANCLSSQLLM